MCSTGAPWPWSAELVISPYDSGMTVVDRPTISGQFSGRFHAYSFPNKLKLPVSTVASHEPKRRVRLFCRA